MKKNVLQLIGSFHQGGSERQALQLARLLAEDGRHGVHLACLDRGGVLLSEAGRLGFADVPEFSLTSFHDRNFLTQLRRFAAYVRGREIAVVHTHDFYTNVFGMVGAALARVPARVASRRETTGFRTPAQLRVQGAAYRLAHAVVANAGAVRRQLISEGVPDRKIAVVYNGMDAARVAAPPGLRRGEALALFGLPANRPLVTILANLRHPVKDHPTFLRAARRVRDAVPEAAFVLAGEGELTERMRAFAFELGLGADVFFTGLCRRTAELLFVSEVCVLSSTAEGFSNSILEYMAAARPVVATEVGGAAEAIIEGETGHLVRPGDDETMAARVIALLRDPARAGAMGERGRAVVEQKFSCRAQLESTVVLYESLLAGTRAHAFAGGGRAVEAERSGGVEV